MSQSKHKGVSSWQPMPVFPTKDSLADVILQAETDLPKTPNEMFTILMTYHNTLLAEQRKATVPADVVVLGGMNRRGH